MKTIMRTCGVLAVLAALLLVIACEDPFIRPPGVTPPPAGMGQIRLVIGNNQARTILPTVTFVEYDLSFFELDGGGNRVPLAPPEHTQTVLHSALGTTYIPLDPGDYEVDVVGRTSIETGVTGDAASGTSAAFTITLGGTQAVTVALTVPVTFTGDGLFVFEYTYDTNPIAASMDISDLAGTSQATPTIALVDGDGEELLPTGYYYVDFEVQSTTDTTLIRRVLHIRQGMVSTGVFDFTDDIFPPGKLGAGPFTITGPNLSALRTVSLEYEIDASGTIASLDAGDMITLNMGTDLEEAEITLDGAAFNGGFELFCNSATPFETSLPATIKAGDAPFDVEGTYFVTVIGIHDGIPYDTWFFVEITDLP